MIFVPSRSRTTSLRWWTCKRSRSGWRRTRLHACPRGERGASRACLAPDLMVPASPRRLRFVPVSDNEAGRVTAAVLEPTLLTATMSKVVGVFAARPVSVTDVVVDDT